MALEGLLLLITLILFFVWRKSSAQWQRTVAWISASLAGASILLILVFLLLYP